MSTYYQQIFESLFYEDGNISGEGGIWGNSPDIGTHGGQVGNTDWYAPGDARNIYGIPKRIRLKKKNRRKRILCPLIRRNFPNL